MQPVYWLGNLAAWTLQSSLLIGAAAATALLFRLRLPRVRLVYGQALLVICLLLPAVEPWHPLPEARVDITMVPPRAVESGQSSPVRLPWRQGLLALLAAGSAARMLWLVVGLNRLRRLRRAAEPWTPLPACLDRQRALLAPRAHFALSSTVSGPVTFGLRRPWIVLPVSFSSLSAASQEAIACHELLHARGHDWIVTVIEEFIRATFWFHPAVWWLIGHIQLAREQGVDGEVVRLTRNRREYLDALLAIAGRKPALDLAPATLFLKKRHLKRRVSLLLEDITMSKRTLISFCAASTGLLLATGWLALHTFPLQAAPQEDSAKLLHSVAPVYPQAARDKHIEGDVVLEVQIDAEGHVSDARVLSGPVELRNAALAAVLQWHYSPKAMSLPASTQVTLPFRLAKQGQPSTIIVAPPPVREPFALKAIQVDGLSEAARDQLLQRLPVHTGDMVDEDVMREVAKIARDFDEHLMTLAGPNDQMIHIFLMKPAPAQTGAARRIRVGGTVQRSKLLVKVTPVYPPEAKAQGIQGLVRLEAIIGKDGKIENLQVVSGDPTLAASALDAVRQWQYQTTLLNGDPVEVITQIDVNFTLTQ
jgi:TonB family protein